MHRRGSGFTIVHLLVVIVLFLVLLALFVPTVTTTRVHSNRPKCQSNLSQMGKALLLYSNENKGAFPRTMAVLEAPISITNEGFDDANPFSVDTKLTPG